MMMKTIYTDLVWCSVLALVFATVLPTAALAVDVSFPDANLEDTVRDTLGIPTRTIITDTDMETMGRLSAASDNISNIQGLEHATNLTELELRNNQISDISAVSGLTNLFVLILNGNQISNITAVSGLTNLERLYLHENQISDISAVSGLTNLSHMQLDSNQINDISEVSGLTNLTYLGMGYNQISDISAVSGLTNLKYLTMRYNQISDMSAISGLTTLTQLSLSENQISNISTVSGMINLSHLYLFNNQISDISAVSGLTNLEMLILRNNQIETMNLSGSNLSSLRIFDIVGNPLKKVLLTDATLSQDIFNVLMNGGYSSIGVAEVGGVLTLDMSGVDFAEILDLSAMYGMDDLEELLLAGAINLDGSELCLLTEELASLNWLDITGAWDGFDMVTQDWLNSWDAVEDNTLVIPEPCSLMLLGLGSLVLRRRKTA